MSLAKIVEERIRQAMAEGEFDNLPGRGKPIDLDDYFRTPEPLRVGFALLKSAKFVPEEVQLLQEMGVLRGKIEADVHSTERQRLQRQLNEKMVSFNLMMESRTQSSCSSRQRRRGTT